MLNIIRFVSIWEYFSLRKKFENNKYNDIDIYLINDIKISRIAKNFENVNIRMYGKIIAYGNVINNGKVLNIWYKISDGIKMKRPNENIIIQKYSSADVNNDDDLNNIDYLIEDDYEFVAGIREDILDILI